MEIRMERPFFMNNEKWYYYDYEELIYKLTDEAPKKAKESYKEYYKKIEEEKK